MTAPITADEVPPFTRGWEAGYRSARIAAVAATLRQLAHWGVRWPDDDHADMGPHLLALAATVEADDFDDVCPICDEVVCDEGCPIEPLRSNP